VPLQSNDVVFVSLKSRSYAAVFFIFMQLTHHRKLRTIKLKYLKVIAFTWQYVISIEIDYE